MAERLEHDLRRAAMGQVVGSLVRLLERAADTIERQRALLQEARDRIKFEANSPSGFVARIDAALWTEPSRDRGPDVAQREP